MRSIFLAVLFCCWASHASWAQDKADRPWFFTWRLTDLHGDAIEWDNAVVRGSGELELLYRAGGKLDMAVLRVGSEWIGGTEWVSGDATAEAELRLHGRVLGRKQVKPGESIDFPVDLEALAMGGQIVRVVGEDESGGRVPIESALVGIDGETRPRHIGATSKGLFVVFPEGVHHILARADPWSPPVFSRLVIAIPVEGTVAATIVVPSAGRLVGNLPSAPPNVEQWVQAIPVGLPFAPLNYTTGTGVESGVFRFDELWPGRYHVAAARIEVLSSDQGVPEARIQVALAVASVRSREVTRIRLDPNSVPPAGGARLTCSGSERGVFVVIHRGGSVRLQLQRLPPSSVLYLPSGTWRIQIFPLRETEATVGPDWTRAYDVEFVAEESVVPIEVDFDAQ